MVFDWDAANIEHIAKHQITLEDAEHAILTAPLRIETTERKGEKRTGYIGETKSGRVIFVMTTRRKSRIRVVTAYPAQKWMKAEFEQHRRNS